MYANLGPGHAIDLDPPSRDGRDLLYTHEYVARQNRRPLERGNLYTFTVDNPVNYVDPLGLKRVCGFYVHFYTGAGSWWNPRTWCVEENVYQAALQAAGATVNCWWECEVETHECVAGKLLLVMDAAGTAAAVAGARVAKTAKQLAKPFGTRIPVRSFTLAQREQLTSLARQVIGGQTGRAIGRSVVVKTGKVAFVAASIAEAGISIRCGLKCGRR